MALSTAHVMGVCLLLTATAVDWSVFGNTIYEEMGHDEEDLESFRSRHLMGISTDHRECVGELSQNVQVLCSMQPNRPECTSCKTDLTKGEKWNLKHSKDPYDVSSKLYHLRNLKNIAREAKIVEQFLEEASKGKLNLSRIEQTATKASGIFYHFEKVLNYLEHVYPISTNGTEVERQLKEHRRAADGVLQINAYFTRTNPNQITPKDTTKLLANVKNLIATLPKVTELVNTAGPTKDLDDGKWKSPYEYRENVDMTGRNIHYVKDLLNDLDNNEHDKEDIREQLKSLDHMKLLLEEVGKYIQHVKANPEMPRPVGNLTNIINCSLLSLEKAINFLTDVSSGKDPKTDLTENMNDLSQAQETLPAVADYLDTIGRSKKDPAKIDTRIRNADIFGRKMYDIKHQAEGLDDMPYTSDDINRAKEDVIGLNTELKKLWDILKYGEKKFPDLNNTLKHLRMADDDIGKTKVIKEFLDKIKNDTPLNETAYRKISDEIAVLRHDVNVIKDNVKKIQTAQDEVHKANTYAEDVNAIKRRLRNIKENLQDNKTVHDDFEVLKQDNSKLKPGDASRVEQYPNDVAAINDAVNAINQYLQPIPPSTGNSNKIRTQLKDIEVLKRNLGQAATLLNEKPYDPRNVKDWRKHMKEVAKTRKELEDLAARLHGNTLAPAPTTTERRSTKPTKQSSSKAMTTAEPSARDTSGPTQGSEIPRSPKSTTEIRLTMSTTDGTAGSLAGLTHHGIKTPFTEQATKKLSQSKSTTLSTPIAGISQGSITSSRAGSLTTPISEEHTETSEKFTTRRIQSTTTRPRTKRSISGTATKETGTTLSKETSEVSFPPWTVTNTQVTRQTSSILTGYITKGSTKKSEDTAATQTTITTQLLGETTRPKSYSPVLPTITPHIKDTSIPSISPQTAKLPLTPSKNKTTVLLTAPLQTTKGVTAKVTSPFTGPTLQHTFTHTKESDERSSTESSTKNVTGPLRETKLPISASTSQVTMLQSSSVGYVPTTLPDEYENTTAKMRTTRTVREPGEGTRVSSGKPGSDVRTDTRTVITLTRPLGVTKRPTAEVTSHSGDRTAQPTTTHMKVSSISHQAENLTLTLPKSSTTVISKVPRHTPPGVPSKVTSSFTGPTLQHTFTHTKESAERSSTESSTKNLTGPLTETKLPTSTSSSQTTMIHSSSVRYVPNLPTGEYEDTTETTQMTGTVGEPGEGTRFSTGKPRSKGTKNTRNAIKLTTPLGVTKRPIAEVTSHSGDRTAEPMTTHTKFSSNSHKTEDLTFTPPTNLTTVMNTVPLRTPKGVTSKVTSPFTSPTLQHTFTHTKESDERSSTESSTKNLTGPLRETKLPISASTSPITMLQSSSVGYVPTTLPEEYGNTTAKMQTTRTVREPGTTGTRVSSDKPGSDVRTDTRTVITLTRPFGVTKRPTAEVTSHSGDLTAQPTTTHVKVSSISHQAENLTLTPPKSSTTVISTVSLHTSKEIISKITRPFTVPTLEPTLTHTMKVFSERSSTESATKNLTGPLSETKLPTSTSSSQATTIHLSTVRYVPNLPTGEYEDTTETTLTAGTVEEKVKGTRFSTGKSGSTAPTTRSTALKLTTPLEPSKRPTAEVRNHSDDRTVEPTPTHTSEGGETEEVDTVPSETTPSTQPTTTNGMSSENDGDRDTEEEGETTLESDQSTVGEVTETTEAPVTVARVSTTRKINICGGYEEIEYDETVCYHYCEDIEQMVERVGGAACGEDHSRLCFLDVCMLKPENDRLVFCDDEMRSSHGTIFALDLGKCSLKCCYQDQKHHFTLCRYYKIANCTEDISHTTTLMP